MTRAASCTFLLPTTTVCLPAVCINFGRTVGGGLGGKGEEEGGEGTNIFETIPQFNRTTAIYLFYRQVTRLLGIKVCIEVPAVL